MSALLSSLAFITLLVLAPQQVASQTPPGSWVLGGEKAAYAMDASGRVTDTAGATIQLRSTNPQASLFGNVMATLPAAPYRQRRVTLSGELQTSGAKNGASIWLRVDRGGDGSMLDNGMDRSRIGETTWTPWTVSMPVPEDATAIAFGVMLQPGGGTVSVRNLRLDPGKPLAADGPMAPAAQKVVDAALTIVKANALRADAVNWSVVEPEVRRFSAGAEQSADVYPAIRLLLARLGDHHSFLMPPAAASAYNTGGAANPPVEVKSLPEAVGYVQVPAYGGGNPAAAAAYATRVHAGMTEVMPSATCGWIVDLRTNGGGNMWPMLSGLQPFLGREVLGWFEGPKGPGMKWIAGGIAAPASLKPLESAWVAVLTGPRTASSGEAVAIAFRGRPNTRSFGLPTTGLSTANAQFPLPDGSTIVLTTSVDVDRTGRKYGEKVEPDELVPADNATRSAASPDATMAAAIRWLKQSSGCGKGTEH